MIYAIWFIVLAGLLVAPAPPSGCDAALAAQLTPARPLAGRYDACTTPEELEDALRAEARDRGVHAGRIADVDPLDAFGVAGPYDRSALSRLFGGRRARVAHGWSQHDGELTSVTYVSPYPNRSFTALVPGTLIIRYTLETRGL
jgi:hypothetical protein